MTLSNQSFLIPKVYLAEPQEVLAAAALKFLSSRCLLLFVCAVTSRELSARSSLPDAGGAGKLRPLADSRELSARSSLPDAGSAGKLRLLADSPDADSAGGPDLWLTRQTPLN